MIFLYILVNDANEKFDALIDLDGNDDTLYVTRVSRINDKSTIIITHEFKEGSNQDSSFEVEVLLTVMTERKSRAIVINKFDPSLEEPTKKKRKEKQPSIQQKGSIKKPGNEKSFENEKIVQVAVTVAMEQLPKKRTAKGTGERCRHT